MRKHFGISILVMVVASITSCISSPKEIHPDAPKPSAVAKQPSTGSAKLVIQVAEDGTPVSVKVLESSGFTTLDQHTTEWIKKKWRWPSSGKARTYSVPVQYKSR